MEGKEIELRSEEVQEVMGQIPTWIVRWGITILFIVVLALLVGSYFFRYPDVITTEMTLTSRHPVAEVVARSSGKINELYVFNGQEVKMGAPLAVVENPAKTEDVFRLKKLLARYQEQPERLSYYLLQDVWLLGDIQPAYRVWHERYFCRDYRLRSDSYWRRSVSGRCLTAWCRRRMERYSCLCKGLRTCICRREIFLPVWCLRAGRPGSGGPYCRFSGPER